ncbi:MAG: nucleotidyltransferase family protein [Bacteroidales bacterium]
MENISGKIEKEMEAIILVGGLGTRLKSVVEDLPKPMAPIKDIPFLEYLIKYFAQEGGKRLILAVGYKSQSIVDYFGNNFLGVDIAYSFEDTPLGTGGAIKQALSKAKNETVFVLNGDSLFTLKLKQFTDFHKSHNNAVSMALCYMENFDRYGTVELDGQNFIEEFIEKKPQKKGLINTGIYLLNKDIVLKSLPEKEKFSFETEFLEKNTGNHFMKGFISEGFFIDIGIPEDFERGQTEIPNFFKER